MFPVLVFAVAILKVYRRVSTKKFERDDGLNAVAWEGDVIGSLPFEGGVEGNARA